MRRIALLLILLCGCRTSAEVHPHGSVYVESEAGKTTVKYGAKIEF